MDTTLESEKKQDIYRREQKQRDQTTTKTNRNRKNNKTKKKQKKTVALLDPPADPQVDARSAGGLAGRFGERRGSGIEVLGGGVGGSLGFSDGFSMICFVFFLKKY